jgi:hypothetical protein
VHIPGRRLGAFGLGVVVFMTTAGACQQEYEGELSEYISCDMELRSTEDRPTNITVHPYVLAAGSVPPATPPCDP